MADGAVEAYSYNGEEEKVYTGFRKEQWIYNLDALGRTVKITNPYGDVQQKSYSPLGNVEKFTDELNRDTVYEYDPAGRLLARINAVGSKHEYEYDAIGRLIRAC